MTSRSVNTKANPIFDDEIVSPQLVDLHVRFVTAQQQQILTMSSFTAFYSCVQKELIENNIDVIGNHDLHKDTYKQRFLSPYLTGLEASW